MSQPGYFDGEKVIDKKAQVRKQRIMALTLGGVTFISITFFVFALAQKSAADKARIEVDQLKKELLRQTEVAVQNAELAKASEMEADLQRQLASAIGAELDNCKHSK
jgi:hypothetical protein